MPKKQKTGKQRRDKAYWAAKEIGYRSRASFKLVQLNRKWEFLQRSNVCLDLCAAPGSWMQVLSLSLSLINYYLHYVSAYSQHFPCQVAKECMPMSSLVVGIDLVPIKPIQGCIALQGDITSDKTKADIKKELKTAKADVVLHDGAPNVGKNWINDAYQQSLLTLSAFKLATEFLCRGGWFVTKVFRSKDYQSLMWVFGQFFKKVHATKPQASRNESAEIFVVCQNYLAPDKIDPKFLDPKAVFSDLDDSESKQHKEIVNPEKKKKKGHREGYEDGATMLYKEAMASDFIMGTDTIKILNESNAILIDTPRIEKHPRTTAEVKECLKDLKVLGMKELRMLKKWRDALKKEFEELDQKNKENEEEAVPAIQVRTQDEIEDEEMAELDKQVEELKDEERRAAKRQKKKELKEKQKRIEKINLKMILPGDEGPQAAEDGLFQMSDLKNTEDLDKVVDDKNVEDIVEESEEEDRPRPKHEKYDKEDGSLDSEGLWYGEHDKSGKDNSDSEEESDNGEELGLEWEEEEESDEEAESKIQKQNDVSKNPLIMSLSNDDNEDRKAKKAEMWFSKIGDIDDDSDLEEAEMERAVNIVQKKGGKIKKKNEMPKEKSKQEYHSDSDEESEDNKQADEDDDEITDSDEEVEVEHKSASGKVYNKDGFEIVPQQKIKKRKALSCEELALGEQLIRSKKAKRDIMDNGWHRFMFDDENLPDWFVKEEEFHMRKMPDIDPEVVEKYREMGKEMNVKTIKKVVEAKARRKRRVAKKLEQARKKSAHILENTDIGSREKANEINKLYKKAEMAGKRKQEVSYVVAKKHKAQKRAQRPANVKGPYKQVKIVLKIMEIFNHP